MRFLATATQRRCAATGRPALVEGAIKIRWGKPGDFDRCVRETGKYLKDPEGYCAELHHSATGEWPGRKGVHASADELTPDPILPAAEPEQVIQHEEDPVSLSDDMRSRLGLADDADETAALAAIDALKAAAEKTPEPTPEMVAASAAATEKATKAEQAAELMKEELSRVSGELATIKASAAASVKASFFGGLLSSGKLKPADRETWEARYDRDPEMVTDILGTRAEGSEVPVAASGVTGPAEPEAGADPLDAEYERLFGEKAGA